jgi:lipid-A-disaccharide synthase
MVYLPYVGLPNILAGRFVVPEFFQNDASPENLARALLNFLDDKEACARIGDMFREIHWQLRQNTAEKAAEAVLATLPAEVRKRVALAAA